MSVIWQLPGAALKTETAEQSMPKITTDPDILHAQRFNQSDGIAPKLNKRKAKR